MNVAEILLTLNKNQPIIPISGREIWIQRQPYTHKGKEKQTNKQQLEQHCHSLAESISTELYMTPVVNCRDD